MKAYATKRLVIDASVTLAWCFPDEATSYSESLLDRLASGSEAIVPAIWPFEVSNALLVGERRKRLTMAQMTGTLERLSDLPILIEAIPVSRAFGQILALARTRQLTSYDAAYLEIALRESLPLATLDEQLRKAAQASGVPLVRA